MRWKIFILAAEAVFGLAPRAQAGLVLDDPLQGSTSGTRSGGTFAGGGWRVGGKDDFIYWHVPTISEGAVEWDVRGLNPNECRAGLEDKSEIFHMYDYIFGDSDDNYNGGYRENPYKHFIRKIDCLGGTVNAMEFVWKIGDEFLEPDTSVLSWDPAVTYHFREEWRPEGGNSVLRTYRNGALIMTITLPGLYAPPGHSIRIGASNRRAADAGAPTGAVYSNVKVWDLSEGVPAAPTIVRPAGGSTVNNPLVFVSWQGESHSRFQVRVSTGSTPDAAIAWDSGEVPSSQDFTFTGALADRTGYQAFVRLGSADGWGAWSAGRSFRVDTSSVPAGPDLVRLAGNALEDHGGPFLGLGATYFSAMRLARNDRARLLSDLNFLRSRGFNYVRILSMVGWNSSWQGIEIAPVSFTSQNGTFVPAWPDYWQQFRDTVDIIHDRGLRAEITIFADAQLMPAKAARIQHMATMLQNLAGREHKVIHLEVGNEAWQNGFPGDQGTADLREFGQYLADRTQILVALSAPAGGTNAELTELYSGSAADIATAHFTRDLGTVEGGWLPVRDCWRVESAGGVPPVSSNEPIGPGSSVANERDPIKLVMAAAFAWGANLPMYVFHSAPGVRSLDPFQGLPGIDDYVHLAAILPPDLASWVRHDGLEPVAPFIVFANGQPGRYWPQVGNPQSGAVMCTGKIKGDEFVSLPIGILPGGLELEPRRPVAFQVYDPLTGTVVASMSRRAGERFTLAPGPGAYIIKGEFTGAAGARTAVSIDLGTVDVADGMINTGNADGDTQPAAIGGRDCRRNVNPAEDHYFYFAVDDGFAFQGSKPHLFIAVDYFDAGSGSIDLQYDSSSGTGLPAYYKLGGSITLGGTNVWRTRTFELPDAYFGNRQNAGADFRLGRVGAVYHIDRLAVSSEAFLPPVIAEVSPDPDNVAAGVEYVKELRLDEGSPAPGWEVLQGPAGLRVDANGRVSGWTPGAGQVGMAFTIEVRATNTEGSDSELWEVVVGAENAIRFPFNAGAEGWALATWMSGPYDPGTMVWESAGGNPGGNVHAGGSGESNNLDTCTREGGTMTRVVSTAGKSAIRIEFDVVAALNVPPGASATGGCAVLEGSSEDKLVVYYSVAGAGGPWTVAGIFPEGVLPSAWMREAIDLGDVPAAEDNPAFAVRLQWQFNSRLDGARIDNVAIAGSGLPAGPGTFRRGDANGDGVPEVSDAFHLLRALFGGGLAALACQKSADANDDGALNITDSLRLLNYLFFGGAQPASPFGACGLDPTPDALTCTSYAECE